MLLAAAAGSSALEDTHDGLRAAAALTLPGFSHTEPEGLLCMPTQRGAAQAPQPGCASSHLQPLLRRAITLGAWGLKASSSPGLSIHRAHAGHQSKKANMERQQAAPAEGLQEQQDGSSDSDKESEGASEGESPSGNAAGSSRLRSALDSRPHSLEEAARLFMQRIIARSVLQVSDAAAVRLHAVHTAAEGNLLRQARSHSLEGALPAAHHCTTHNVEGVKAGELHLSLTNSYCWMHTRQPGL